MEIKPFKKIKIEGPNKESPKYDKTITSIIIQNKNFRMKRVYTSENSGKV